jgi:hypothetical protein
VRRPGHQLDDLDWRLDCGTRLHRRMGEAAGVGERIEHAAAPV